MPNPPSIIDGPLLEVKKKVEYDLPCPKCRKDMRVTEISSGAVIECSDCGNATWSMDYNPPWWSKTSRFITSLLLAFILGTITSIVGTIIYKEYFEFREVVSNFEVPSASKKR